MTDPTSPLADLERVLAEHQQTSRYRAGDNIPNQFVCTCGHHLALCSAPRFQQRRVIIAHQAEAVAAHLLSEETVQRAARLVRDEFVVLDLGTVESEDIARAVVGAVLGRG